MRGKVRSALQSGFHFPSLPGPQSSDVRRGALSGNRVGGGHDWGAIVGRVALPQCLKIRCLHGFVVL